VGVRAGALLLALAAAALPAAAAAVPAPVAEILTTGGKVSIEVEVAATPRERSRGLMGRTRLARGHGMAFLFPRRTRGGFWMRGTRIPLTAAFVDGGRIVAARSMTPCRADPCPLYDPGRAYRWVLEVRRGELRRLGVRVGDPARLRGPLPRPS
jgi:uncharacterized membrane protein (UPF0127 family)